MDVSKLIRWIDSIDDNGDSLFKFETIISKAHKYHVDPEILSDMVKERLKERIKSKNQNLTIEEIDIRTEERYQYLWGNSLPPLPRNLINNWVDDIDSKADDLLVIPTISSKAEELGLGDELVKNCVIFRLIERLSKQNPMDSKNILKHKAKTRYRYIWGSKLSVIQRRQIQEYVDEIDTNVENLLIFPSILQKCKLYNVSWPIFVKRVKNRLTERIKNQNPVFTEKEIKRKVKERYKYIWGMKTSPKQHRLLNEWVDYLDDNIEKLQYITSIKTKARELKIHPSTAEKGIRKRLQDRLREKNPNLSNIEILKCVKNRFSLIWGNSAIQLNREQLESLDKWIDEIDENCEDLDVYLSITLKAEELKLNPETAKNHTKNRLKNHITNKIPDLSVDDIEQITESRFQYLWGDRLTPKQRRLLREWVIDIDENAENLRNFSSIASKAQELKINKPSPVDFVRKCLIERLQKQNCDLTLEEVEKRAEYRFQYLWGDDVSPYQRRLLREWTDYIDEHIEDLLVVEYPPDIAKKLEITPPTARIRIKKRLEERILQKNPKISPEEIERYVEERYQYIWGDQISHKQRRLMQEWADFIYDKGEKLEKIPSLGEKAVELEVASPTLSKSIKNRFAELIKAQSPGLSKKEIKKLTQTRFDLLLGPTLVPILKEHISNWFKRQILNLEHGYYENIQSITSLAKKLGVDRSTVVSYSKESLKKEFGTAWKDKYSSFLEFELKQKHLGSLNHKFFEGIVILGYSILKKKNTVLSPIFQEVKVQYTNKRCDIIIPDVYKANYLTDCLIQKVSDGRTFAEILGIPPIQADKYLDIIIDFSMHFGKEVIAEKSKKYCDGKTLLIVAFTGYYPEGLKGAVFDPSCPDAIGLPVSTLFQFLRLPDKYIYSAYLGIQMTLKRDFTHLQDFADIFQPSDKPKYQSKSYEEYLRKRNSEERRAAEQRARQIRANSQGQHTLEDYNSNINKESPQCPPENLDQMENNTRNPGEHEIQTDSKDKKREKYNSQAICAAMFPNKQRLLLLRYIEEEIAWEEYQRQVAAAYDGSKVINWNKIPTKSDFSIIPHKILFHNIDHPLNKNFDFRYLENTRDQLDHQKQFHPEQSSETEISQDSKKKVIDSRENNSNPTPVPEDTTSEYPSKQEKTTPDSATISGGDDEKSPSDSKDIESEVEASDDSELSEDEEKTASLLDTSELASGEGDSTSGEELQDAIEDGGDGKPDSSNETDQDQIEDSPQKEIPSPIAASPVPTQEVPRPETEITTDGGSLLMEGGDPDKPISTDKNEDKSQKNTPDHFNGTEEPLPHETKPRDGGMPAPAPQRGDGTATPIPNRNTVGVTGGDLQSIRNAAAYGDGTLLMGKDGQGMLFSPKDTKDIKDALDHVKKSANNAREVCTPDPATKIARDGQDITGDGKRFPPVTGKDLNDICDAGKRGKPWTIITDKGSLHLNADETRKLQEDLDLVKKYFANAREAVRTPDPETKIAPNGRDITGEGQKTSPITARDLDTIRQAGNRGEPVTIIDERGSLHLDENATRQIRDALDRVQKAFDDARKVLSEAGEAHKDTDAHVIDGAGLKVANPKEDPYSVHAPQEAQGKVEVTPADLRDIRAAGRGEAKGQVVIDTGEGRKVIPRDAAKEINGALDQVSQKLHEKELNPVTGEQGDHPAHERPQERAHEQSPRPAPAPDPSHPSTPPVPSDSPKPARPEGCDQDLKGDDPVGAHRLARENDPRVPPHPDKHGERQPPAARERGKEVTKATGDDHAGRFVRDGPLHAEGEKVTLEPLEWGTDPSAVPRDGVTDSPAHKESGDRPAIGADNPREAPKEDLDDPSNPDLNHGDAPKEGQPEENPQTGEPYDPALDDPDIDWTGWNPTSGDDTAEKKPEGDGERGGEKREGCRETSEGSFKREASPGSESSGAGGAFAGGKPDDHPETDKAPSENPGAGDEGDDPEESGQKPKGDWGLDGGIDGGADSGLESGVDGGVDGGIDAGAISGRRRRRSFL